MKNACLERMFEELVESIDVIRSDFSVDITASEADRLADYANTACMNLRSMFLEYFLDNYTTLNKIDDIMIDLFDAFMWIVDGDDVADGIAWAAERINEIEESDYLEILGMYSEVYDYGYLLDD